ncbi:MAG TPA: glycosyltransferase family 4 protein [Candidatus Limnocylindrales bacterium]|nr:glycosyltransferase family 4 protein [Candidatus Limnocylindrales bacterium]
MVRRRVLTWHVHGSYLEALGWIGHEIVVPAKPGHPEGYGGRPADAEWPDTIREVPANEVRDLDVDVVLFQSPRNYLEDQEILSDSQRRGPRVYLEHDPPRIHPTDTKHVVDDPDVTLVHVTAFNDLMWDSGRTPTRVVEHGIVPTEGVEYGGELERGLVVVNNLDQRGRRLGLDIFQRVREEIPLDLVGMGAERLGGIEAVPRSELPALAARYRFFFHPIRYTSFGMAVCEAMMIGLPIVALATTEMPTVIVDGVNGFADTSVSRLIESMKRLLADRDLARRVGAAGRALAVERFGIARFARDWNAVIEEAIARSGERRESRVTAEAAR